MTSVCCSVVLYFTGPVSGLQLPSRKNHRNRCSLVTEPVQAMLATMAHIHGQT